MSPTGRKARSDSVSVNSCKSGFKDEIIMKSSGKTEDEGDGDQERIAPEHALQALGRGFHQVFSRVR